MIDKEKLQYFVTKELRKASRELHQMKKNTKDHAAKVVEMNVYKNILDLVAVGAFDYECDKLELAVNNFDDYIKKS